MPLQIAIDQEQGVVTRIGPPATQFPGSMALGAGGSAPDARTAAAITGRELLAMGVNTNFAPVCDVNVNPLNPVIGTRSFSSHPDLAAELVAAQVAGYQRDGGVSSSAKHFPGHGDTATDSHVAFPVITHTRAQWESIDAPPFRAAIREQIDMIMTAHLAFPALDDSGNPATLSKPIMTGVLREELGFDGIIVTDSLAMQGVRDLYGDAEVAVRALLAGVDQLLMTPAMDDAYAAVLAAVRSGRIQPRRARHEGASRAAPQVPPRRRAPSRMPTRRRVAAVVGTPAHLAAAASVTDRTTTLVKNDDKALPIAPSGKKVLVTGYGVSTTATLAAALTAKGATVQTIQTGTSPTDAAVASAVAAASDKDVVVVTTMKAWDTGVTDTSGWPAEARQAAARHGQDGRRRRRARSLRHRLLHRGADLRRDLLLQPRRDRGGRPRARRRGRADGLAARRHPRRRRPGHGALPVRPRPDLLTSHDLTARPDTARQGATR